MKTNKLIYDEPSMEVLSFESISVFTLHTSGEYNADQEGEYPSIDDILGGF